MGGAKRTEHYGRISSAHLKQELHNIVTQTQTHTQTNKQTHTQDTRNHSTNSFSTTRLSVNPV